MQKIGKLNSSIDIIPLQGTSDGGPKGIRSSVGSVADNQLSRDPRDPRVPRDPLIISRVQMYMYENEDKVYIDVNDMADNLRKRYRDYRTKKRGPFRAMVRRAYDEVTESFSKKSDEQWNDDDDDEVEVESDSQEDTLSKEMIKMYKKSIDNQNGNSSDKELIDISSDDDNDLSMALVKKRRLSDVSKKSAANSTAVNVSAPKEQLSPVTKPEAVPPVSSAPQPSPKAKTPEPAPSAEVKTKKRPREKDTTDIANAVITKKKKASVPRNFESKIKFADVGGNAKVLETVCRLLVHMRHPEIFKQLGISSPRGFLLHGPPGCGKTLLAHAIAGELGVPLIKVAAPELVAGVSGESESRIREVFEQAVAVAPCVLFLDEVDAVATHRATAQREMERRIVAQLLSCLDDLNTKENGETVLVLGATNRPDALDPALRRAGRFDREISLGIPDKEARASILAVHAANLKLADDVSLATIAALTPGFVGADLVALLTEAAMAAVNRIFDSLRNKKSDDAPSAVASPPNEEASPVEKVAPVENGTTSVADKTEEPSKSANGEEVMSVTVEESAVSQSAEATTEIATEVPVTSEALAATASTSAAAAEEEKIVIVVPAAPAAPATNDAKSTVLEGLLTWLHNAAPLSPERLAEMRLEYSDFETALRVVQPSAKREGFATVPDVTWNDVGSLQNIREELQMAILAPVRHSERFAAFGLNTPTGVLLCGPPGCGKTLLAKAIANEAGINFISVKGPELLNMYVGESEKAVRQCFIRARNSAPCVIFFDELDALCPKRSEGDNNATSRVVNQMLTEMDGVEGRKGVYLMAASNRPDIIDPAVLRPGRLDKILYVGLPTAEDRVDILKALTKNGTKPRFSADVSFEEIGKNCRCEGYSGADLASLVREAATEALRESMATIADESSSEIQISEVAMRHVDVAFDKVRPSVHEKDAKHYEKLRKLYSPVKNIPEVVPMDTPVKNIPEVVPMDSPVKNIPEVVPMDTPVDTPVDTPMIDATMEVMET